MLTCTITSRDGTRRILTGMEIRPVKMSWQALGGPREAELEIRAPAGELEAAYDQLGCPLAVWDELGKPAWWGYVNGVETWHGCLRSRLDLGPMANRVQVEYGRAGDGPQGGAAWPVTDWLEDLESSAVYGAKELRLSLPGASLAQAMAYAQQTLEERRLPSVEASLQAVNGDTSTASGKILACGWWQRMNWTYCRRPGGQTANLSGGRQDWLGAQLADSAYAQSVSVPEGEPWTACWLRLRVKKIGSPQDSLLVEICADGGGLPGTVLSAASLEGASISNDLRMEELALDPPVLLQPGERTWIKLSRSEALSGYHYYMVDSDQGGGSAYPGGSLWVWNGSAWAEHQPGADLWFELAAGEDTALQCEHLLADCGVFSSVAATPASGIPTPSDRDDTTLTGVEVERLLSSGSLQGARMLAEVGPGRQARIYPCPQPGQDELVLDGEGRLYDPAGIPLQPWQNAWGRWARLKETVSPPARLSLVRAPGRVWIERLEYREGEPLKIETA